MIVNRRIGACMHRCTGLHPHASKNTGFLAPSLSLTHISLCSESSVKRFTTIASSLKNLVIQSMYKIRWHPQVLENLEKGPFEDANNSHYANIMLSGMTCIHVSCRLLIGRPKICSCPNTTGRMTMMSEFHHHPPCIAGLPLDCGGWSWECARFWSRGARKPGGRWKPR